MLQAHDSKTLDWSSLFSRPSILKPASSSHKVSSFRFRLQAQPQLTHNTVEFPVIHNSWSSPFVGSSCCIRSYFDPGIPDSSDVPLDSLPDFSVGHTAAESHIGIVEVHTVSHIAVVDRTATDKDPDTDTADCSHRIVQKDRTRPGQTEKWAEQRRKASLLKEGWKWQKLGKSPRPPLLYLLAEPTQFSRATNRKVFYK